MKLIKITILIIFTFLMLLSKDSFAQKNRINTFFENLDNKIIIHYIFQGDPSSEYDVSIILKRSSKPSFSMVPKSLTGDFGKGDYANEKREIIWHLTKREEDYLIGDDYYFEIMANIIKGGGGSKWLLYVGGILLGGAAAVLLSGKKDGTTNTSSGTSLPGPPGRPN